jgi:glycosyltransferase involved in cell wall biosynthesis
MNGKAENEWKIAVYQAYSVWDVVWPRGKSAGKRKKLLKSGAASRERDTVIEGHMDKKKTVVLVTVRNGQRLHKLWENFLNDPPKGYRYIDLDGKPLRVAAAQAAPVPRSIMLLYQLKKRIPLLYCAYKEWDDRRISRQADAQRPDLVYCLNGRLYHGDLPWVVDAENPLVFFGYTWGGLRVCRSRVRTLLSRKNCEAIIPYSQWGAVGLDGVFGKAIAKKMIVSKNIIGKMPARASARAARKGITILFTGSTNVGDSFYERGGKEAIEAFLIFAKRHPDAQLIMRCHVPPAERERLKGRRVEIFDTPLDKDAFDALFARSDVYLLPGYIGYALSNLEAMSHGLPIVTSNILENGENIKRGVNGFAIEAKHIDYPIRGIPRYYLTGDFTGLYREEYAKRIAAALETLAADPALRKRMGEANRRYVASEHTIGKKNADLSRIFARALRTRRG